MSCIYLYLEDDTCYDLNNINNVNNLNNVNMIAQQYSNRKYSISLLAIKRYHSDVYLA